MRLSNEQENIVKSIKLGNNIISNSVAGSGKSTTIKYIVETNSNKKILVLSYNKSLRKELIEKLEDYNNVDCHTFHSFGFHNYTSLCINDANLIYNILWINKKPLSLINFDILVIDEMQDIDKYYYKFILKIINDNVKENIQLALFGDVRQTIYSFKGADYKYFINGDLYFKDNIKIKSPWEKLYLTYSFRITDKISNFINNHIDYDPFYKIYSKKYGEKIRYISTNNTYKSAFFEIKYYLDLGYDTSDIFIILASVKSIINENDKSGTLKDLQRYLTKNKIFIEILETESEKDIRLFKNKLVISTIHGTKGLERKVTILLNFDNGYFNIAKSELPTICPNTIYVALTRSIERSTIIARSNFDRFLFLKNISNIDDCLDCYVNSW